jgi:hypothetical protein
VRHRKTLQPHPPLYSQDLKTAFHEFLLPKFFTYETGTVSLLLNHAQNYAANEATGHGYGLICSPEMASPG